MGQGRCSHEDAENGGVLKHEFLNYGIPFETVPPTTVKKYATGKGNAKKLDMYDAFVERTGVEVDQFKAWSDIVDSYFILCISEIGVKDSPHPHQ